MSLLLNDSNIWQQVSRIEAVNEGYAYTCAHARCSSCVSLQYALSNRVHPQLLMLNKAHTRANKRHALAIKYACVLWICINL